MKTKDRTRRPPAVPARARAPQASVAATTHYARAGRASPLPHPLKLPACLDARCSVYSGTFFPFSSTTHQAPHKASSGSSSFLTKREVFQFSTQLWQLTFTNARITDYDN